MQSVFLLFQKILVTIKGELHPKPKLSMLYVLSQNYQHLFKPFWVFS